MDDGPVAAYTELLRTVGTFLYGRRRVRDDGRLGDRARAGRAVPLTTDFANAWQTPRKIVYSTTLAAASTANTRIERAFDVAAVRQRKADASRDSPGGADLAAQALRAGLVDECDLFVWPIAVGHG
jgi:riboflavin biosynthesis pyrimidine reductase